MTETFIDPVTPEAARDAGLSARMQSLALAGDDEGTFTMFRRLKLHLTPLVEQEPHDKVLEAGACLGGGPSVDDEGPKDGGSVNGVVHPNQIGTKVGARP